MFSWWHNRRCPHMDIQGIYGDNIIAHGYKRLHCADCGCLLDGPVSLTHPKVELARIRDELAEWRDLQEHNAKANRQDGHHSEAGRNKMLAHQINLILKGNQ